LQYLISAAIAPLVGIAASYLGLGGGFLLVPYMVLVLGMDPHVVTATSLIMIFSLSTSSAVAYLRLGLVKVRVALILEAFTIPMAVLGSILNWSVSSNTVEVFFGIFLLATGMWTLVGKVKEVEKVDLRVAAAFSTLAGLASGFLGVGGGVLKVPILMFSGLKPRNAVATSSFMIMLTSLSALLTHAVVGEADYLLAAVMIPGLILGAQLGPRLAKRSREIVVKRAFGAALCLVALRMILEAL